MNIQNYGETTAKDVVVTINLPSGLSLSSGTATQTISTISGGTGGSGENVGISWTVSADSATTSSITITVTPSNADAKTETISVTVTGGTTTTTPGGGGSSGGGGFTSNSQKWTTMEKNVTNKMMLSDKSLGIKEISIQVNNKANNVTITVTKLAGKPTTVNLPSGTAYQWIEITHDNLTDDNVKSAKIRFNVSRSWLINNSFSTDYVVFQRYSNGWTKLTTIKISESSSDIEYEAETPGLSIFAITAEKPAAAPAIVCGNNIREGAEECDGTDIAGQTCQSKGFDSGTLKCSQCVFDVSGCKSAAALPPNAPAIPVKCGDGRCDSGETSTNCPQDCEASTAGTSNISDYLLIIIAVVVVIIVAVIGWFYYHEKHMKNPITA
jgi:PGF-pre-PGF domain-containing protein